MDVKTSIKSGAGHPAAASVTPLADYFRLTTPGSYLNERPESHNFTFNGRGDIKSIYMESAVEMRGRKKRRKKKDMFKGAVEEFKEMTVVFFFFFLNVVKMQ